MMLDKPDSLYSLTAVVPMIGDVLTARQFKGPNGKPNGEPKYSGGFMFAPDSPDLKAMKSAAAKVAQAKWPGRELKELKFPFTSGDKIADKAKAQKKDREFLRGHVVVQSRSKFQPRLAVIDGGRIVDLDSEALMAMHKSKFYSGVEVLVQFNIVAYDGVGANPDGVTAYLQIVTSTGKGQRRGGGVSAAEVFRGYAGSASTEDPTGGALDDDFGL